MDTTSIVTSYPASADGEARLQGAGTCPAGPRRRGRDEGRTFRGKPKHWQPTARRLTRHGAAEIMKQPNPLDSVALSYQGGVFVALDFTPEEKRPKAARSICPTTT